MKRSQGKLWMAMQTLLIGGSLIGCASHPLVLDPDKSLVRLKTNTVFKVERNGWFVPDALWLQLNEAWATKLQGSAGSSPHQN